MPQSDPFTSPKILRLPQVMARIGLGRSWIYAAAADGRFVAPVKIGRATAWDAAAVDRWIERTLQSGVSTQREGR